jgi:hypothetical protein
MIAAKKNRNKCRQIELKKAANIRMKSKELIKLAFSMNQLPTSKIKLVLYCMTFITGQIPERSKGFIFLKFLFYSYMHTMFGLFLSPFSHPLPYPPAPSLSPPPHCYKAETILPLSLILLKREYKQ